MSNTLRGKIVSPEAIYGKSAYELAVLHGFEGTEEEWLAFTTAEATRAEEAADRAEAAVSEAAKNAAEEMGEILEGHTYDGSDYYTTEGPNLFNINDPMIVGGHWDLDENGALIITEGERYRRSHPIKVYTGVRYRYSLTYGMSSKARVVKVDAKGNPILLVENQTVEDATATFLAEFTGYVSFNFTTLVYDKLMFCREDQYPEEYAPFSRVLRSTRLEKFDEQLDETFDDKFDTRYETASNPLKGKSITIFGDELLSGTGLSGQFSAQLAAHTGMTCQNISTRGTTIAGSTFYNDENLCPRDRVSEDIFRMNEGADYAIIGGGMNDAMLGVPMGELSEGFDSELKAWTFYGGMESALKQLITRYPGKKIGYVISPKMRNGFRSDEADDGTSYYWAAKRCCEKWGVPYLDLNVTVPAFTFFDGELASLKELYTVEKDVSHQEEESYTLFVPNDLCYQEYIFPKIEAWLRTL